MNLCFQSAEQLVVIQKELQACVQDIDKTKKFYFDEEHSAHDVRDKEEKWVDRLVLCIVYGREWTVLMWSLT
jgi:hypothetical protein